ncbi:hypothetical protein COPRO5265_0111 [Coprothermobacter proteolyticus DSM 5265]|uniref:Uncharacterized protein n=1 Tax=Coprothermobacter proteolyticus (strain ATCC 35245 / DSM 5265 / OCM 4 / BT) TaxID=309798 RepID=B5Y6T4_COPPD|nr:hypothetical protein [Coprothermobacter proteolyticus]ACI17314.1 hypothetical protein COPRO5265_0111 [Coprothermobacter proteolyticus DSM 5265]
MKKGIALITVLAFVLILSLLMVPLYVSVLGMTSTLRSIQVLPAKHEAFAAGLNVVRVLIVNAQDMETSTTIELAQGPIVVTASLARSFDSDLSLQDEIDCEGTASPVVKMRMCSAVNYWDVTVHFKDNYVLTGTAVQYVMFQPDKDYVYLLDFKEKRE